MKTMMLASAIVLGLGSTAAFAESEGGVEANTYFTELPGVVAQAPVQRVPQAAAQLNGGALATFITSQQSQTWQAPPSEGGNN